MSSEKLRKHGESQSCGITKEYKAWMNIKYRCDNPNNYEYEQYGGRGITMCQRWRKSYENFLSDMGRAPGPGFSVERKNNNAGYKPGNCVWATPKTQANNRRFRLGRHYYLTSFGFYCTVTYHGERHYLGLHKSEAAARAVISEWIHKHAGKAAGNRYDTAFPPLAEE
jgi:hypothetical protein